MAKIASTAAELRQAASGIRRSALRENFFNRAIRVDWLRANRGDGFWGNVFMGIRLLGVAIETRIQ
jgi:hypothetical protein